MGLTAVPTNELAAIVTHLEMWNPPSVAKPAKSALRLTEMFRPSPDAYRALFRKVGAPWLWFSRLVISDEALLATIHNGRVKIWAVTNAEGEQVGMLELDFRKTTECEIAYFGLVPELNGKGHGRWLMAETMAQAWERGVERVWVHTCSLDHPSALNFYRRQGFKAFKREIETFPDPRLTGHLPIEAAPQIPLFNRR